MTTNSSQDDQDQPGLAHAQQASRGRRPARAVPLFVV